MNGRISCDIIIPVLNKPDLTAGCLDSISKHTHSPYRIIIIDNASDADTKKFLDGFKKTHENTILITNVENAGWVKAVNQGIRASDAPYVCVMNNDTVVETGDWLAKLIAVAESEAGIGLVNPNFEVKCGCACCHEKPYTEIDFCRGYCIVIKRAVIGKIGGLDEAYGLGYYDDDDFSVRAIRAGFTCVKANAVTVLHLGDSTFSELFADQRRRALHQKNKELFYAKWGRRLRVLFIVTKDADRKKMADLLVGLARRQHKVYVWNTTAPFSVEHTSIRERSFRKMFFPVLFKIAVLMNISKKAEKRYNVIFADNEKLCSTLRACVKNVLPVYCFDSEKDEARIGSIVDEASKV